MDALDREFNEMCRRMAREEHEDRPAAQTYAAQLAQQPAPDAHPADIVEELRAFAERLGLAEPTPPRNNAATQRLLAAMQAQWDAQRKRPGPWGMP